MTSILPAPGMFLPAPPDVEETYLAGLVAGGTISYGVPPFPSWNLTGYCPYLVSHYEALVDIGRDDNFAVTVSWECDTIADCLSQVGPVGWAGPGRHGTGPVDDLGLGYAAYMLRLDTAVDLAPQELLDPAYYNTTETRIAGVLNRIEPGHRTWRLECRRGMIRATNSHGATLNGPRPSHLAGRTWVGWRAIQICHPEGAPTVRAAPHWDLAGPPAPPPRPIELTSFEIELL